ncbi:YqjD family protein [Pseudomonadota bacterium AL_CKDN230030165-1A_HGKHYDSX7]
MTTRHQRDIAGAKSQVKQSLSELISGTEALLRSTATYGGAEIESARDRLKHQLESAREHVGPWERAAVDRARRWSHATDGYVHDNAWKTIGVAAVLGAVIGACLMSSDSWRR